MLLLARLQHQERLMKWYVSKHILSKKGMLQLANILPWLKPVIEQAKRAESPKNETTRLRNAIYSSEVWGVDRNQQMAHRELSMRLASMRDELRKITSDSRNAELPMLTLLSKERNWSSDPITHHTEVALVTDRGDKLAPQVYMVVKYEAQQSTYVLKKAKAAKSCPFMRQWRAVHNVIQALSEDASLLDAALDNLPLGLMSPSETCNLEKMRKLLADMQTNFLSQGDNFEADFTSVSTCSDGSRGELQPLERGDKIVLCHSSFMHD